MVTWLTNATKRIIVQELRDIMTEHPRYRGDANNVQNKFSYEERPARGIIVNGTSADRVVLSADNYIGRQRSFIMVTPADGKSGNTVEWVRENQVVLSGFEPSNSTFPTPPGSYRFRVLKVPDDARSIPGEIEMEPVHTVFNEPLITFRWAKDFEATIPTPNLYPGSVRLWFDQRIALVPDVDYTINYETGEIVFLRDVPEGFSVTADYRYRGEKVSPIQFRRERFDVHTIPGAVIAFGDRCEVDDRFDIVVTDERVDTADVYGGKFEVEFELMVFTKDAEDREKLADYITMSVLNRQLKLSNMGMELLEISPGSESEDTFNSDTDTYYFESTARMRLRVEWSTFIPLPAVMWRIEPFAVSTSADSLVDSRTSTIEATANNFASLKIGSQYTMETVK